MKKAITLILIFFVGLVYVFINKPSFETDILKSIIKEDAQTKVLIDLNKKVNSDISVIFESDDSVLLKREQEKFCKEIVDKKAGNIISTDESSYLSKLNSNPKIFLTYKTRELLKQGKYSDIQNNSLMLLYNPMGIPIVSVEKDPYLFVTDFIQTNFNNSFYMNDKFYSIIKVKTQDVGKIISIAKHYNTYLSGTPVHSYKTAKLSSIQINIFCILAILFVIFLCSYMFSSYKIFFAIMMSILFGFGCGYIGTSLIFNQIHILTMVFATTLIGIGIDYSLHYYSHKIHDRIFYKNLTSSMLTTIIAFALLLIPNINLLNQISVYTILGLIGVYLFVLFIFPVLPFEAWNIKEDCPQIKINKKAFYIITLGLIIIGFSQLKFDDSIKNLYTPNKSLAKAEKINQQLVNPENKDISFIIVSNQEKEEIITDILNKNNVNYISGTKFVPTIERQKENISLVDNLYKNNLDKYATFLTKEQISNIKQEKSSLINDFDYSSFKLGDNRYFILAYDLDKSILGNINDIQIVNIQKDVSENLYKCRKNIEPVIPILFLSLILFLSILYGKKSLKIIIPPILGGLISIAITQIFKIPVNVFTILTTFLIIGFTIDYSIFKSSGGKNSNIAVLSACASTVFSFFLLIFAGFKLISTLGLMLSVGIIASYISSCVLFDDIDKI